VGAEQPTAAIHLPGSQHLRRQLPRAHCQHHGPDQGRRLRPPHQGAGQEEPGDQAERSVRRPVRLQAHWGNVKIPPSLSIP